ncbi:hypothetical protein ABFA07_011408 [Porites harrisoni]
MASCIVWSGRVAFFALLVTQGILLASYPAKYKEDSRWYGAAALYAPSIVLWLYLLYKDEADLGPGLFYVWGSYITVGLIPSIGIVFGVAGDGLGNNDMTLGPIMLKATLCATPLLVIALLNTASDIDDDEDRELVYKLCVQLAVDLLDAVEMIDIVLDEKEHDFGISEGFGIAMITVACFSFLLSLWPMIETEMVGDRETNSIIIRNFVEIFGVNGVFLIIRLVIVFKYEKDESIFIAKNIIAIILSGLEIRDKF